MYQVSRNGLLLCCIVSLPLGNQYGNKIPIDFTLRYYCHQKFEHNYSYICLLHAARPPCKSPEYWCHISPNDYAEIEIGEEQPAKIVCTIPYINGHDIRVINQFGNEVRRDPELRDYVKQVLNPLSNPIQHTHNKSFHLEIYRPKDEHVQEKLRVIQCIGLLRGSTHPCRTSLINIHFTKEEGMKSITLTRDS